jgi:serine/threonine protein kinase
MKYLSSSCQDLILKLVNQYPSQRLSSADALLHPWFKDDREALEEALSIINNLN